MKRLWNTPSLLSLEAAIATQQRYNGSDPQGADTVAQDDGGFDDVTDSDHGQSNAADGS